MDHSVLVALITAIGGLAIAIVNRWPSKLILADLKAIKAHLGIEVRDGKVIMLRTTAPADYQTEKASE
jgi:hypothetical protein